MLVLKCVERIGISQILMEIAQLFKGSAYNTTDKLVSQSVTLQEHIDASQHIF